MSLLVIASLIIAGSVALMARRAEVRLVLLGSGLLLSALAGRPLAFADAFARAMVATMVGPICASMGFAAVLAATGCDGHLIRLLLSPIRRARWAVLPGGIASAYLVNLAVPSQASTAAMLGPVLVPLVVAAGFRRDVAGAALVLGASFGGDLLNPGAQDVQALASTTGIDARSLSARVIPSGLTGLAVAAIVFHLAHRRSRGEGEDEGTGPPEADEGPGRVDPLKAAIPMVPVALLLLAHAGFRPLAWLIRPPEGEEWRALAGALPVVRAMLVGTLLAVLAGGRDLAGRTLAFFEGMGSAYGRIISLTIAAQCFGAGIDAVGLGVALLRWLGGSHRAMAALSVGGPWALATLSGSGSGPVLAFGRTFLAPMADRPGAPTLGALTCLAAAFGRTMSPVSAVVVYGSGLAEISPMALVRRLLPALLAGAAASIGVVWLLG